MTYSGLKRFLLVACFCGSMTTLGATPFQLTLGSGTNLGNNGLVCAVDTENVTSSFTTTKGTQCVDSLGSMVYRTTMTATAYEDVLQNGGLDILAPISFHANSTQDYSLGPEVGLTSPQFDVGSSVFFFDPLTVTYTANEASSPLMRVSYIFDGSLHSPGPGHGNTAAVATYQVYLPGNSPSCDDERGFEANSTNQDVQINPNKLISQVACPVALNPAGGVFSIGLQIQADVETEIQFPGGGTGGIINGDLSGSFHILNIDLIDGDTGLEIPADVEGASGLSYNSVDASAPEPGSLLMIIPGLGLIAGRYRKRFCGVFTFQPDQCTGQFRVTLNEEGSSE